MTNVIKVLVKYKFVLILSIAYVIAYKYFPNIGHKISSINYFDFIIAIILFPPVFVLVGLGEEWINRELMIKLMGKEARIYGSIVAFLLGSFGMGPLYVAFPIAIILLKKGASFRNMYIFIGAWSTARVQQLLYEVGSLGIKYTVIRFTMNFIGILCMGVFIDKTTSSKLKNEITQKSL